VERGLDLGEADALCGLALKQQLELDEGGHVGEPNLAVARANSRSYAPPRRSRTARST
jgi:hypothetical protein